jgi:hypothetical protein
MREEGTKKSTLVRVQRNQCKVTASHQIPKAVSPSDTNDEMCLLVC